MEIVLTATLVSVILGTASAAQNVGAIAALGVGRLHRPRRPVVGARQRHLDEPRALVRPGAGQWRLHELLGVRRGAARRCADSRWRRVCPAWRGGDAIARAAGSGVLDEGALPRTAPLGSHRSRRDRAPASPIPTRHPGADHDRRRARKLQRRPRQAGRHRVRHIGDPAGPGFVEAADRIATAEGRNLWPESLDQAHSNRAPRWRSGRAKPAVRRASRRSAGARPARVMLNRRRTCSEPRVTANSTPRSCERSCAVRMVRRPVESMNARLSEIQYQCRAIRLCAPIPRCRSGVPARSSRRGPRAPPDPAAAASIASARNRRHLHGSRAPTRTEPQRSHAGRSISSSGVVTQIVRPDRRVGEPSEQERANRRR